LTRGAVSSAPPEPLLPSPLLPSRIEAVTVFRRAAQVTRRADFVAGEHGFPAEVRIGGLPLMLEDGTVRVRVEPVDEGVVAQAQSILQDNAQQLLAASSWKGGEAR